MTYEQILEYAAAIKGGAGWNRVRAVGATGPHGPHRALLGRDRTMCGYAVLDVFPAWSSPPVDCLQCKRYRETVEGEAAVMRRADKARADAVTIREFWVKANAK